MIATVLPPGDERWLRTLEHTPHDVYHRPEYVRAAASHEGGRPAGLYAEDASGVLLIPLLIRSIPDTDLIDASSPYGYPAPLWTAPDPSPHWTAVLDAARERGIVSAFIRLHPLLPAPSRLALRRVDGTALVEHGPTVWIDCTRSSEAVWADTRSDHQSDIRRLRRLGYEVDVGHDTSHAVEAIDTFVQLYHQTMDRVGADPFYYFSDSYFEAWTGPLRPYGHVAVVRGPDGEAAAAGLFTTTNGRMQYHLSGTNHEHRARAPSKLMIHEVRTRARASGVSHLHLGGGLGAARDSLFAFKAGFGPLRGTFSSLRIICDQNAYDSLCTGTAPPPSDGVFPAYREE
jgi:hypothetical protein